MNISADWAAFLVVKINETNFSSNSTTLAQQPQWSLIPVFLLVVCILGLIANGTVLYLFARDRQLRSTPFNIYVINLMLANFLCTAIQYPTDVIYNLLPSKWTLSYAACSLHLYCISILSGVIINSHALIALNRTWAIVHYSSYRSAHSARFAITCCLGVWLWVHIFSGPNWIAGTFYYGTLLETMGCASRYDILPTYSILIDFCVFLLPFTVILLAFPVIVANKVLRHRRKLADRKKRAETFAMSNHPGGSAAKKTTIDAEKKNGASEQPAPGLQTSPFITTLPLAEYRCTTMRTDAPPTAVSAPAPVVVDRPSIKPVGGLRSATSKYLILAGLTISVTVCFLPELVFYTMVIFAPRLYSASYYQVSILLYSCETLVDPVMFTLSLEKLRQALFALVRGCVRPR